MISNLLCKFYYSYICTLQMFHIALSVEAVEYTNCISAEG